MKRIFISPRRIDLISKRFGKLVVIDEAAIRVRPSGQKARYWKCQCDCGETSEHSTGQLRNGRAKSCGCGISDAVIARCTKHGFASRNRAKRPSEYQTWKNMRERCSRTDNKDYKYYGGRGIRVCQRWNDFAAFYEDMGPRPSRKHSIDRIDSNGHYEPSNCRWATPKVQSRNRTSNHLVTVHGRKMPLSEAIEKYSPNLRRNTVLTRIRRGWPVDRALFEGTH